MRRFREVMSGVVPAAAVCLATAPMNAQEVVELPGEDRWLAAGFEEVFRLGTMAGEEWEQFGSVRKVAFDAAGRLYVFDTRADRIYVVGTDGGLVRAIGRGGGPGGVSRRGGDGCHGGRAGGGGGHGAPCLPGL